MASTSTAPKEAPTAAVASTSAAPPSRCITPLAKEAPAIPPPAAASACPPDPEPPSSLPTAMVAFNDA
ncbi:MAG TPA: hypothetical protein VIF62_34500, partial [Labilithrix sp.]